MFYLLWCCAQEKELQFVLHELERKAELTELESKNEYEIDIYSKGLGLTIASHRSRPQLFLVSKISNEELRLGHGVAIGDQLCAVNGVEMAEVGVQDVRGLATWIRSMEARPIRLRLKRQPLPLPQPLQGGRGSRGYGTGAFRSEPRPGADLRSSGRFGTAI